MLDQLSRFTILKLSFKESILEHQSGGKAVKRAVGGETGRAVYTCKVLTATQLNSCISTRAVMQERKGDLSIKHHGQRSKAILVHLRIWTGNKEIPNLNPPEYRALCSNFHGLR